MKKNQKFNPELEAAMYAEEHGHYCWAAILYRRLKLFETAEFCEIMAQYIASLNDATGF